MNAQPSDQRGGAGFLRWFRNAMLLLFLFAAFLFFGVLSWGTYGFLWMARLGVGIALLPGILYVVFGIVLGVVLGWITALLTFCKRRFFAGH